MDEKQLKELGDYLIEINNILKDYYQTKNIDSLKSKYSNIMGIDDYKKMLRRNFEEASAEQSAKEIWEFGRFYDLTILGLVDNYHFTKEDAEDLVESHTVLFRHCFNSKNESKRTAWEIWRANKIGDPFEESQKFENARKKRILKCLNDEND